MRATSVLRWVISLLLFCAGSAARGQSALNLFNVDISAWPTNNAQFYAFDAQHQPLSNLSPSDFTVTENGLPCRVIDVSCPPPGAVLAASVVLSMDISGSMGMYPSTGGNMSIALSRAAATTMLDAFTMPPTTVALQTCTDVAAIVHDFTSDRLALDTSIRNLQPGGSNDFVEQLLNPRTGALNIAKTGTGSRAVVLLTDAWWSAMPDSLLQRCIDTCAKYGITFYAVIFTGTSAKPTGIKSTLGRLAVATGGQLFDGVVTMNDAGTIARGIQRKIQGSGPCTLTWEGIRSCASTRDVVVALTSDSAAHAQFTYTAPPTARSHAMFDGNSVRYGFVIPGVPHDTTVLLTAQNAGVTVQRITISDPRFSTVITTPFTIPANGNRAITIRFLPTDSLYAFGTMTLETDACVTDVLYLSGGIKDKQPTRTPLKLLTPNGGEMFAVGDSIAFTWTGVLPTDTVRLDFSPDGGFSWIRVSDSASGLRHMWRAPFESNTCLARVSQLKDFNDTVIVLPGKVAQYYGPYYYQLYLGGCVKISPSDSILLVNGADSVRLYRVASGKRYLTLGTNNINSGSNKCYSGGFSPDGRRVVGGMSVSMWDAYSGVLLKQFVDGYSARLLPPTGSIVMIKSAGNSSSTYDVASGSRLHVFPLGGDIGYSPTGGQIASPGAVNTVEIWDVASGSILKSFSGHKSTVNTARLNQAGQLLSASNDGTAKLWNVGTGTIQYTLAAHRGPVLSAEFSADGTKVLTVSADSTAKLWDASSGWQLRTFGGPGLVTSVATLRADGAMLATASNLDTMVLWDARTGLIKRMFVNDAEITEIELTADGSRAVTVDAAGVVKIWMLDSHPLQEDQSDALWRIVAPHVATVDVDFGTVLIGSAKDSVVTAMLTNSSDVPAQITQMNVAGFNVNDFLLASGSSPVDLPAHSSRAVELRFTPLSTGARVATLVTIASGDTLISQLRGMGALSPLKLVPSPIDFGTIIVDTRKDTTVTTVLKNISATPLTITASAMTGPDLVHFVIDSGVAPFTLGPNESHTMKLAFAPHEIGRTSGAIAFTYNGVGSPARVTLFGNAISAGASINAAASVTCPTVTCATPQTTSALAVSNLGGTPLVLSGASVSGPDANGFAVNAAFPVAIAPGASANLDVVFTPQHMGPNTATVVIHSNAVNDSALVVTVAGNKDTTAYQLSATDIDLGMLCPHETRDTSITLRNAGTTPLRLVATTASPVTVNGPWDLALGGTARVDLHLAGDTSDVSQLVTFIDSACGIEQTLRIHATIAAPAITLIPFTSFVPLGSSVNAPMTIFNRSSRDVVITAASFSDAQFTVRPGQLPLSIAAHGSAVLMVGYAPAVPSPVDAVLTVSGTPCGVQDSCVMRGIPTTAWSVISLPVVTANPGEHIAVPVKLEASHDLDTVGARHFTATMRIDGGLVRSLDTGVTAVFSGNALHVTFSGTRTDTTGMLATLHFMTLVADRDTSPLTMESFSWTDGAAQITTIDGALSLNNLCPGAGPLKVRYVGVPALTSIRPNPASGTTTIGYRIATAGHVRIELCDMLGRVAAPVLDADQARGDHTATFSATELASGIYTCILRAPDGMARYTVIVTH